MKQILISVELNVIEDIIKILEEAIHPVFARKNITVIQQYLMNKSQSVMQEYQNKILEEK